MNFIHRLILICILTWFSSTSFGQKPIQHNSTETYHALEKLNTLLSVLYVAAHPDDENQRLISYCANELNAYTSYLSLTRGDGGQNLIGEEIGPLLGVLRTQELLGARRLDGGNQYFTRAIDFGYSKHPDETFGFWNKDQVLGDVVRVIRRVKPDIIINRFDHRTPGKTHGHHTASAMLSLEAFDLTNDKSKYPDQLSYLETWQPSKLYFNTSWWFYGGKDKFAEADKSNLTSVDISTYYPMLGTSNSEIAAYARSMHRCQGFGNASYRGSKQEYLEYLQSSDESIGKDLLDGIDYTWNRVEGGQAVGSLLENILANYDFTNPVASLPSLVDLYSLIEDIEDEFWRDQKLEELKVIIQSVSGLYLEATTESKLLTTSDSLEIKLEATNRSDADISIESYSIPSLNISNRLGSQLELITEHTWFESCQFNQEMNSNHYWLNDKNTYGSYYVEDETLVGDAIDNPLIEVEFNINVLGKLIPFKRPVTSLNILRDKGEDYKPLAFAPKASVAFDNDVYVFAKGKTQSVNVLVESLSDDVEGKLTLDIDKNWTVEPAVHEVSMSNKGLSQTYAFQVTPPTSASSITINPSLALSNGMNISNTVHSIEYDHIPSQQVILSASSKAVNLDIDTKGKSKIAYIEGAGDKVAECLSNIGYTVDIIEANTLGAIDLSQYQAIILGIRIYNVNEDIVVYQDKLFDYAKQGGNLITQYNTTWSLNTDIVAPVPLEISRDRVSDETAQVDILDPNHPSMFWPNQLTDADFDDWVQERGLYFPDEFDEQLKPMLSMHDNGEDAKLGSLLVMQHGEGYFVYTGLSFFRELPAGVPGAYRLMANLISLGSNKR